MSDRLRDLVDSRSSLKGSAKNVLAQIAHFSDDRGEGAYPSVSTIAKRIGRDIRTAQRGLEAARESGELDIFYNAGPNGTNRYRLMVDRLGCRKTDAAGDKSKNVTGDKMTYKGRSSLKRVDSYSPLSSGSDSSLSSGSGGFESSASVATPTRPARETRPPAEPKDSQAQAEKNGYMSCRDCGAWLSRCHCGDDLNASFDAAMRDTLDAGKSGPAQVASEAALRKHHADWQPGKIRDVSQAEVDAGWDAVEQKLLADSAYQRMLTKYEARRGRK